jgi:hypothetical protein
VPFHDIKEIREKRGSALRLCAFAGKFQTVRAQAQEHKVCVIFGPFGPPTSNFRKNLLRVVYSSCILKWTDFSGSLKHRPT